MFEEYIPLFLVSIAFITVFLVLINIVLSFSNRDACIRPLLCLIGPLFFLSSYGSVQYVSAWMWLGSLIVLSEHLRVSTSHPMATFMVSIIYGLIATLLAIDGFTLLMLLSSCTLTLMGILIGIRTYVMMDPSELVKIDYQTKCFIVINLTLMSIQIITSICTYFLGNSITTIFALVHVIFIFVFFCMFLFKKNTNQCLPSHSKQTHTNTNSEAKGHPSFYQQQPFVLQHNSYISPPRDKIMLKYM